MYVILLVMSGCAYAPPMITGSKFESKSISQIKIGTTTKDEIFGLFGPPRAIAIKEEPLYIYQPAKWKSSGIRSGVAISSDEVIRQMPDAFFEIFSTRNKITDIHRVYFYYYAKSSHYAIVIGVPVYEKSSLYIDRLWLLINEETGIVEDLHFIPRKE
ncbi:MAG: hypothetical protein ABFQ64_00110 [Campylobacterota bacterium]